MEKSSLPVVLLALDMLGAVLVGIGVAAIYGVDFGFPVLLTVAPILIGIGLGLMAPFLIFMIRKALGK